MQASLLRLGCLLYDFIAGPDATTDFAGSYKWQTLGKSGLWHNRGELALRPAVCEYDHLQILLARRMTGKRARLQQREGRAKVRNGPPWSLNK